MRFLNIILLLATISFGAFAQEYVTWTENFDNNKEEWPIEDKENTSCELKSGYYWIRRKTDGASGWWTSRPINHRYEYEIETAITLAEGQTNWGYGLLFGKYDWDDYYNFIISGNGSGRIWGRKDEDKAVLKDWTNANVKPKGETNVLRITHKDNITGFYINDELFHEEKNLQLVGKQIGFKIEGIMKVKVDYLKVKYYDRPINLAKGTSTVKTAQNLGAEVNSEFSEVTPCISADGNTLYFVSKENDGNIPGSPDDIWYTEFVDGKWTEAKNIGAPLNTSGNNTMISVTPDGNRALVKGKYGTGSGYISIAHKINGKWQQPIPQEVIGFVNHDRHDNRFLSSDGTKMIMSIDDGDSYGNSDLYISFLDEDHVWSVPMNMGPVLNSYSSDFAPFLAVDGKTLFFASYGHPGYGSSDIFMSRRIDDTWLNWTEPVNLGPGINSEDWEAYYVMSAKADYGFMAASKDEGFGRSDIYSIEIDEALKPDPVILVKGQVYNAKTKELIDAHIEYENLETGRREGMAISSTESGYKIVLPKGAVYGFRAEADDYFSVSQSIDTKETAVYEEVEVDLYLVPIEQGQKLALNNTFFDPNESVLRPESQLELNRVAILMRQNLEYRFEIGGHTDNVGKEKDNIRLSEDRAKAVYNYLISRKVPEENLTYRGYGESYPVESNKTDEGRQKNRRVEIRIL